LDAGTTFSRYGIAAAIVLILALIPGIALRRRLGPVDLTGGVDLDDEEPADGTDEGVEG
jgi:hypothetical protein